jgi:hypothetical protein
VEGLQPRIHIIKAREKKEGRKGGVQGREKADSDHKEGWPEQALSLLET